MEFRLLGGVAAQVDGRPVNLGHARQRLVLAALLIEADHGIRVDQLLARVWGDRPPRGARSTLHSYLSRLRGVLSTVDEVDLVRLSGGYVLTLDETVSVDLHAFRRLAASARDTDQDDRALALFEQALELWRGPAFGDVDNSWFNGMRDRLNEERLAVELDHADIALRLGQHSTLLAELSARAAEHPLAERIAGQLMLALYRNGHQAEALRHYANTRKRLAEELGADPSPPLQRIHHQVLTGTAGLDTPETEPGPNRHCLPRDAEDFTGRDGELDRLLATVPVVEGASTALVITVIDGMAGVGKTALAVRAAHRLADRYPDAHLFLDLNAHTAGHGPTDPAAALGTLLRLLGVPGPEIPQELHARAARWRAELAGRRTLVVLDNAVSASQVRPLLPGTPDCLVLITSRHRLTALESANTISLDVLPAPDSVALFARVVGDDRALKEHATVAELARLCGHLPLAVRITAARLRARASWTVAYLVTRLREQHRRLGELTVGDRSVCAVFELSYHHLTPDQQRLFRLLGLHPGIDVDSGAAAALVDTTEDEAARLLEELVDFHLLEQPTQGRYRFHDLLRVYAAQVAGECDRPAERHAALTRLFDHYRHRASMAMDAVAPHEKHRRPRVPVPSIPGPAIVGYDQAMDWLEAERANLMAVVAHAAANGWPVHAGQLATILWRYLDIRGHHDDSLTIHSHARDAANAASDRVLEGHALHHLGIASWRLGRYAEALVHHRDARDLSGDRSLEGYALSGLGLVQERLGHYPEALAYHQQALAIARDLGDRTLEGRELNGLGNVYRQLGRYGQALLHHRWALRVGRDIGERALEGFALSCTGNVYRQLERFDKALAHHGKALVIARETSDRVLEGHALNGLGHAHHGLGEPDEATRRWQQALVLFTRLGGPEAAEVRRHLQPI